MKIIITGSNGQVGWELKRQGANSKHQIIAFDRQQLDIQDKNKINEKITEYQPDLVINAAAYTAVDQAEKDDELAFSINRDAVANLAEACYEASIPLFHISTDYVFDGSAKIPYMETDFVSPLGVYGKSKYEGEVAVRRILEQHIIIRTSWVFGLHGNNFVKTILRVAAERDELKVVNDQIGNPTSARSIASALLEICDQYAEGNDIAWGTYHFSGDSVTSWYGFAKQIVLLAKKYHLIDHDVKIDPIPTSEYPTLAQRPANSQLATDLIQENFSIDPDDWQSSLDDMLSRLAKKEL